MATGEQIVSNQFNSSDVIEPSVVIRSCEPCSRDGSATKATVFCKVCKEILCDECSKPHTKYKPGRHDIVNIQDMGSAAVMVDMKDLDLCEEHGKAIKFYCEDHSKLCCSTCTFTHRKCDNVDEIKSISLKNEPEFQAIKHALIKMESEAASIMADSEKSRGELNESIAKISDEGDKIKDRIVKLFEEAQQKMFTEINQFKAEVSMQLDKKYTAASQIQEQINQILPMYSATLEHGTFEQKFILSKKTKEKQNTIETHVDSQRNATVSTYISLSFSRELQELLTMENPIFQMNFDQQCSKIVSTKTLAKICSELQIKLQEERQKASQQMQMLELEISCLRGQLGERDQMLTQYKSQQANMTLEHQRQWKDLIEKLDHFNSELELRMMQEGTVPENFRTAQLYEQMTVLTVFEDVVEDFKRAFVRDQNLLPMHLFNTVARLSPHLYIVGVQSLQSQLMSLIQEVKKQSSK
ncbi:uncharacterized protein LOC127835189 isoform X1 [Dreissena polymorpha]|uniref:B box-type domain-containing protein n=1 Tax=Dreissena polymorpha TaxID=45954 RepID=A0A9D4JJK5_DREPO|nr:uncharacterized protein LOC127835189 isoform X1 [Dreissena polymorpha]KAH3809827.1 hypothetical protein DPMN_138207 [Dreissena polymorpha]